MKAKETRDQRDPDFLGSQEIGNPQVCLIVLSCDQRQMELISVRASFVSCQVIAVSKELKTIKEHWNWLKNDMATACSFFSRQNEKEESELWDFLVMKFTTLAQQESRKRVR